MWIARNKNNDLFLFSSYPLRQELTGNWVGLYQMKLADTLLFPELTNNDEPIKVKIIRYDTL